MAIIGIFFGSDTGNTENIAKNIQKQLGKDVADVHDIAKSSKEDLEGYDILLLGIPTWYYGEAQCDWDDFFPTLEEVDFNGKLVALFGCGDQEDYAEYFCDGGEKAQRLAESIEEQDDDTSLIAFAMNLFDIVGINQDDRGDNLIVLTPSDHMLVPDFPGLPEDGCTITFERDVALSREDAQFITWEHPLIRNGLDLILSGDTGSSTISLLKNKALPVGTLLVELVYVVEAQAPKQLQLNRFLPPTPVRMLLDKNGNNLAAQVEFETFNRQLLFLHTAPAD